DRRCTVDFISPDTHGQQANIEFKIKLVKTGYSELKSISGMLEKVGQSLNIDKSDRKFFTK
ncbi:unnamed protein product, partial [Ceratitis capitata]